MSKGINYKQIPLNSVPSPIDERDFKIATITAEDDIPNYETDINDVPVENQLKVGGCVSESGITTLAISRKHQLSENPLYFSRGMSYANRYITDVQTPGMQPRQCWQHYYIEGLCLGKDFTIWKEYPDIKVDFDMVKDNLFPKAIDYKIKAYYRLNTVAEIKAGIKKYGAVNICIPIYERFYDTPYNDNIVPIPEFLEGIIGFHEMYLYGWKDNKYFLCRNSWGKEWTVNMNGSCLLPFEFPIAEAWAFDVGVDNILPVPPQSKVYYRVQIYAFKNRNNASLASDKLRSQGINCCLVYENGYFKIQCGCFSILANRDAMVSKLKSLGYTPYVIKVEK